MWEGKAYVILLFSFKKAACLVAQELEPQWNESHCASTGLRYRRSIQFEGEEGTAVMSHSVSLLCTLLQPIIRTHFPALENKVGSELCRNESATLVTVRTEEELEVLKEYMSERDSYLLVLAKLQQIYSMYIS